MQSSLLSLPQQHAPEVMQYAPEPPPAASYPSSTVELGDLKRILVRRRFLILATAALLTLGALLYGLFTPALYSSVAEIIVDPQDLQVVTNDVNPSRVPPDGGITMVESQVAVVQSSGVLLRAIAATNLTEDPEFNGQGGLLSRLLGGVLGSGSAETDKAGKTLDALRRRLAVKRADKVLVLDVIVTAKSADKAAKLANAIAQAYLADQASARAKMATDASDSITARLDEQRKRVQRAENAVEAYRSANNMVMAAGNLVSDQELTEINTQLAAAQSRTATLKAQVDQLRRSGGAPDATSEAMRSAVISSLRAQEATLVDQVSQLGTELGPRHPSMMAAQQQLRDTRALIARELGRIAAAAETDYERALANQQALEAKVAGMKSKSLDTDQASVKLRELQRDLEAVRSVYATYLQRAQETREQVNVDSTNARIISDAMPALKKSWPPLLLLVFGAFFGGLGLGTGMALIAEYSSPTVLSSAQMQSAIDAPVVGVLPAKSARRRWWPFGGAAAPAGQKMDAVAGLALRRLFSSSRRPPNWPLVPSILVTSAPEDAAQRGRVARLLANAAAARGSRVLFIDTNNAGGSQKEPQPGLLDVLRGEYAFEALSQYAPGSNVALLGKGRPKAAFSEAQGVYFTQHMLAQASRNFELVVVDGGALADNLNASPLVAMVDEIVLVATLNATPMRDVTAASQAISVMGRLPTGALLVDEAA
ncbi:exopolysaccharide transport family protein [Mesorhizobium sp. CO1-1-7]|uniref:GumC family protein n=1 Tax=unclassified Mesorhizobium TaxID=325217 RepID=UPI0011273D28|nr:MULTISPECIES: Wzz/FepE/Etk N-terminal domain-containing protein [unclassified Mesorhizobium]MBZ9931598.1 exopolysaccharide transport family protein [Mesorhizobium sp. BR1-1-5]MBZ9681891.1 exopolysaccharide transport family protein [Mesorhizobium sp. CO1-1-2]MBZ9746654.1 exopolysaccharide transport family protein [Mesorhizobium sp. CO1-1-7]MBZ9906035.1 exopolysaccharide transport family protein [Mesorhizobium sp. BR115XR7A]MBZ9926641.1 exopolysaccharide transport family protein [Mesorhizobiu